MVLEVKMSTANGGYKLQPALPLSAAFRLAYNAPCGWPVCEGRNTRCG
jgi:hypothetical protein